MLCNPSDDSIFLGNLMWDMVDGVTLRNPINMSEWSNTLAQQTYQLNCPSAANEIIAVTVNIYGELICRICTVETPYLSTNCLSQQVTENILLYVIIRIPINVNNHE